jgi:hypothetical protein
MLAGNVKLKNFLMVASVVGIAGIVGLYFACRGGDDDGSTTASRSDKSGPVPDTPVARPDPVIRTPQPVVDTSGSNNDVATNSAAGNTDNLREVDRALLGWKGKNLGGNKKKDVTTGRPYKVNLYQDSGQSVMNRAKIDLDRDDKWDEKWTFDGDQIARKVAPNDDENYTLSFDWTGTDWKPAP